jgi:hypothetical protein
MADPKISRSGALPEASHAAPVPPAAGPPAVDPVAVIRSKAYLSALVIAAVVGIPISAIVYGFLALVAVIQRFLFSQLPQQLLGGGAPAWWPVPWLVLSGVLTALTIRYLPGNGGHSPAFGFRTGGAPFTGRELPLLAVLLMGADGVAVTPQVVVAVAASFVISNLLPVPGPKAPESQPPSQYPAPGKDGATSNSSTI